jgi:uncharacterized RmlC-like cupin family protein
MSRFAGPVMRSQRQAPLIAVPADRAGMRHRPKLEHVDSLSAGDFVDIAAGVPHQP